MLSRLQSCMFERFFFYVFWIPTNNLLVNFETVSVHLSVPSSTHVTKDDIGDSNVLAF